MNKTNCGVVTQRPAYRTDVARGGTTFIDEAIDDIRAALYQELAQYEFAQDRAAVYVLTAAVYRVRRITKLLTEHPARLVREGLKYNLPASQNDDEETT